MLGTKTLKIISNHQVFVGFVVVLVIFEIIVRSSLFWSMAPSSQSQRLITVTELALADSDPSIVIFGNSIMRNALSDNVLADELGIEQAAVVNLSISSGVAHDFTHQFDTFLQDGGNLKLVVVSMDPRSFDVGQSSPGIQARFRKSASLEERLLITNFKTRTDLIVGWLWRTWDARYQSASYAHGVLFNRKFSSQTPVVDDLGRWDVVKPSFQTSEQEIFERADKDFAEYSYFDGVNMNAFEQLVRSAADRDAEVLLLQYPVTDLYIGRAQKMAGAELDKFYSAVADIADIPVNRVGFTLDDCPTTETCYTDYGHMNEAGSAIYSKRLADLIYDLGIDFR
jgi:hypothetical protein